MTFEYDTGVQCVKCPATEGRMNGRFPTLLRIARATYGRMLTSNGKVTLRNESGADLKAGPYLYLLNHVAILDPIMVSAVAPKHIRWVAGAYLFKNKFLHKVIGEWCTAIAKQQGRSDLSMIKNIQKALQEGDNVGLFPEGTRTWDGEMMPINYKPLAKLLRYFKFPVLFVHLEGGFAHHPRWADYKRRGHVTVNVKHMLSAEQIASMDLDTLQDTIREYIRFSNDEWKQTVDYSYVSDRRAEGAQRLLYMCPKCRGVDTLRTSGNRITCSACNTVTVLNDDDNLTSIDVPFTKLSEWHNWEASEISGLKSLPPEKGVLFQRGDSNNEGELETLSKDITVQIEDEILRVDCNLPFGKTERYDLPLSKVTSLVLNAKQTMELFCEEVLYRIRLQPDASSLKYHEYYLGFQKRKNQEETE